MLNDRLFSSDKQDWETPQADFDVWNKKYNFTLDPCCTLDNCKCPNGFFYDLDQDGLKECWHGRVFMNPPYNQQKLWIPKAVAEAESAGVEFVVGLLPARTDTRLFHAFIWDQLAAMPRPGVQVNFLQGRLKFSGQQNSAPFPSMLVKWEF